MRHLSVLLIFCLSYTFAHEAMCHGGPTNTSLDWLSHAGQEHHHWGHGHFNHSDPREANHDSDHHDDDSHDHQLRILLLKNDPTTQQQAPLKYAGEVVNWVSGDPGLEGTSNILYPVSDQSVETSLPDYLCAHVLRL